MKTPMTEKIQAIIAAVQAYARFLHCDMLANESVDTWIKGSDEKVRAYYLSLTPKSAGLSASKACLRAVRNYPIEMTFNTEMEELPKRFSVMW